MHFYMCEILKFISTQKIVVCCLYNNLEFYLNTYITKLFFIFYFLRTDRILLIVSVTVYNGGKKPSQLCLFQRDSSKLIKRKKQKQRMHISNCFLSCCDPLVSFVYGHRSFQNQLGCVWSFSR